MYYYLLYHNCNCLQTLDRNTHSVYWLSESIYLEYYDYVSDTRHMWNKKYWWELGTFTALCLLQNRRFVSERGYVVNDELEHTVLSYAMLCVYVCVYICPWPMAASESHHLASVFVSSAISLTPSLTHNQAFVVCAVYISLVKKVPQPRSVSWTRSVRP